MSAPGRLLLLPSVHVIEEGGALRMDRKFRDGLALHARDWAGPMRVVIRAGHADLPFADRVDPADLPCELIVIGADAPITPAHLDGVAVILAAADDARQLHLPGMARAAGARLVYAVEYDLRTRLRIARLDLAGHPLRMLRSWQWLAAQEVRRRRALAAADAVQANGFPARRAYGGIARDLLLYLDGRMSADRMAGPAAAEARAARTGPLRMVWAGRLAPMKGAQDIVPLARALRARGVDFTLDVFGDGPLAGDIARAAGPLDGRLRLHGPVDFDTVLVPAMRDGADLFLAQHRQSDPSCAYLEAMGCGVPVAGAANRMWSELARVSGGGWVMPPGRPEAQADIIAGLSRPAILAAGARALRFARDHDSGAEFRRRMDHLRRIAP